MGRPGIHCSKLKNPLLSAGLCDTLRAVTGKEAQFLIGRRNA